MSIKDTIYLHIDILNFLSEGQTETNCYTGPLFRDFYSHAINTGMTCQIPELEHQEEKQKQKN